MPKIRFAAESIEGVRKIVDEGTYFLSLTGFKPKISKAGDSINFNPILEISNLEDGSPAPARDDGKAIPVFYSLNSKNGDVLNDFCHSFGLPMEEGVENGKKYVTIPGVWTPEDEPDIEKSEYKGPLVGRKGKAYLVKGEYNGQPKNEIKYFICAIDNCAGKFPKVRHNTNLLWGR